MNGEHTNGNGYPVNGTNGNTVNGTNGYKANGSNSYLEENGLGSGGKNGYYSIGANPPPAWSNYIGPEHKAPAPVATQLVVPTDLSDGPVDLTCVHCQHHVTTRTKTGPSILTWALSACLCLFLCWPCVCVPFCCGTLNVTEHYCSNCDKLLGKYKGWKGRADP